MRWPSGRERGAGHRRGLCVLTLHRIGERCAKDHDITWSAFRTLLDGIAGSEAPVDARLDAPDGLDRRSVVLTFDDGTADHIQVAGELAKRGMPGVFFIPAGAVGRPGHLSLTQLRELSAFSHRVGAHGWSHLPLHEGLPPEIVRRELADSKRWLEDATGTGVVYFAPPGGIGHGSLARALTAHGYTASRSMRWGIYRSLDNRWNIPCLPVTEFTLARGWVTQALCAWAMPLEMRAGWAAKQLVPEGVRFAVRDRLHGRFRTA